MDTDARLWIRDPSGRTWGPLAVPTLRLMIEQGIVAAPYGLSADGVAFEAGSIDLLHALAAEQGAAEPPVLVPVEEVVDEAAPDTAEDEVVLGEVLEEPVAVAPPSLRRLQAAPPEGRLEEVSAMRLYYLIAAAESSGLLILDDGPGQVRIWFKQGRPHAVESRSQDLGLWLVERGAVGREQVAAAARQSPADPVGALIAGGHLSPAAAFPLIQQHSETVLLHALLLTEGPFAFDAAARPPASGFPLGDRWEILAKAARRLAALATQVRIASAEPFVPRLVGSVTDLRLTAQELRLVGKLDGTRPLSTIIEEASGLEGDQIRRLVVLLWEIDRLSWEGAPGTEGAEAEAAEPEPLAEEAIEPLPEEAVEPLAEEVIEPLPEETVEPLPEELEEAAPEPEPPPVARATPLPRPARSQSQPPRPVAARPTTQPPKPAPAGRATPLPRSKTPTPKPARTATRTITQPPKPPAGTRPTTQPPKPPAGTRPTTQPPKAAPAATRPITQPPKAAPAATRPTTQPPKAAPVATRPTTQPPKPAVSGGRSPSRPPRPAVIALAPAEPAAPSPPSPETRPAPSPAPAAARAPRAPAPAPRAPAVPTSTPEEDEALIAKLRDQSFFERLGIAKTEQPPASLKATYFGLVKRYHPDLLPAGAPPAQHKLREEILALFNEAYGTLSHPAKLREYLEEIALQDAGLAKMDIEGILRAEDEFRRAVTLVNGQRISEGLALLESCIRLNDREGEFYAWRGWASFLLAPDRRAALRPALADVQHALELNPRCAVAHLLAGNMAKLSGDTGAARKAYQKVLDLEPNNVDAQRELRLFDQRGT